jgi:acyl carrier protein
MRTAPSEGILRKLSSDGLQRIIKIVRDAGHLSEIREDEDFYDAGFSSINALQLLLDLEAAFDVTIPDDEFVTARTCTALHQLISRIAQGPS